MDLNIDNIKHNDLKDTIAILEKSMYSSHISISDNYDNFQKDRKIGYLLSIHKEYNIMFICYAIYRTLFFSIPSNNFYYKIMEEAGDIHEKILSFLKNIKECKI